MRSQMIGTLGQNQIVPVCSLLDRDQHGGRSIAIARERLWRTEAQNLGEFVGQHGRNF
jgi:hypothetical protein